MSKPDKEQIVSAFTEAYTKQHGKAPQIEAKGGWYSVDGGKNIRLAQLEEMTAALSSEGEVNSSEQPKAKPQAKEKAKKAAKKSSFSVKDFWIQQIRENNSGAINPR